MTIPMMLVITMDMPVRAWDVAVVTAEARAEKAKAKAKDNADAVANCREGGRRRAYRRGRRGDRLLRRRHDGRVDTSELIGHVIVC